MSELGLSNVPYLKKVAAAAAVMDAWPEPEPRDYAAVKATNPRVRAITVYRSDVVVKYAPTRELERLPGEREEVRELSPRSRARLAFVAANTAVEFRGMITLTYPAVFPEDGREVKRQLNRFLSWLRSRSPGLEYLWFLEFQRRGAPHVHILTSADLSQLREDVSARWYAAVGSEDERHLRAGTRCERIRKPGGGARYAVKYAAKMRQKRLPEGYVNPGRWWGHSRGVKPEPLGHMPVAAYLDTVRELLSKWPGWERLEHLDRPVSCLYNASEHLHPLVRELLRPGEYLAGAGEEEGTAGSSSAEP